MYTRTQIIAAAKEILKREYDIDVICTDTITHASIPTNKEDFEDRVASVVHDTLYWEGRT
jgi:hypothetical protein